MSYEVIKLRHNSPEWLAFRKTGIGQTLGRAFTPIQCVKLWNGWAGNGTRQWQSERVVRYICVKTNCRADELFAMLVVISLP